MKHLRTDVMDVHKERNSRRNLLPTRASPILYANTVCYQTVEWCCAHHPCPNLPSPLNFVWELKEKNDHYAPVMCMLPYAPETVLQS